MKLKVVFSIIKRNTNDFEYSSKRGISMKKIKYLFITLLIICCCIYAFFHIKIKKDTSAISPNAVTTNTTLKANKVSNEDIAVVLKDLDTNNQSSYSKGKGLRKFPYPYNSMLAISSDIDDTTLEEFETYHKFLNTKEQTSYGQGIGLDIGDSMWLFMADDSKSQVDKYGNGVEKIMTFYKGTDITQKHNKDEMIRYINAGWIDSLHTIGDFSTDNEKNTVFNRKLAADAWNELKAVNIKPTVWINHGNRANTQNFGGYGIARFMNYQQGDNPKSLYYHTDLTIENGIKYVWNSLSDDKFGQDYPLYEIKLRDGKKVWGFNRYTNNMVNGKEEWTWNTKDVYRQLTQVNLDNLVKRKQYSIVTQHLGAGAEELFSQENIKSLRMLAEYEDSGKILVARTSRLLNYANVQKNVSYSIGQVNGITYININSVNDPIFKESLPALNDVRGLTFYCDVPEKTVLLLNKNVIDPNEIQINPKDETGKSSISIKWFKFDYTDYTKR